MQHFICSKIRESIDVKTSLLGDQQLLSTIQEVADLMVAAYQQDKKVFFCGNGGSAADAQHLAAELSGRFYLDRDPLYAEALHVNSSFITAVANDYSYEEVYARLMKAMGRNGDILIGISTSGKSKNIINAFRAAKKNKVHTIALTGESGGDMVNEVDFLIKVPSNNTPRIQESHILIGHILCEIIENELFAQKKG